jgi:hypothetical protein
MMQFLKSILSRNKQEKNEQVKIIELQIELSSALKRLTTLEEQVMTSSSAILELSQCIQDISKSTQFLSKEFLVVTTLLQQAADTIYGEKEALPKLKKENKDTDDDDYLN